MPPPPASGDSYSRQPGDLDLLTLEQVRNVSRGMDNLRANFNASATFLCRVMSDVTL